MHKEWFGRLVQAAAITVTVAAICQELEKPAEERQWHGRVGFVPYDFRVPTLTKIRDSFWNPREYRVFTERAFGVGWAINFHALMENPRIMSHTDYAEEDFLMPTESIKGILGSQETLIEI